ncbi:hypothetical protein [Parasedimentitalea maritima]|uniref:AAA domain-containing protein n=1 Tax=Parasedimentitalea maritima TaxID=2578117 RepID=A0A6A4RDS5_9RHOB|nr:hypothetical protein [Zongyanglinia marina]KAE9627948.1 hypothetical protein GP644_17810 [Zongyanglinia marina]
MTQKRRNIRIDRLAMMGPEQERVDVSFVDGVNIIWGASNAGKSFVRKAIDYVLGGEKPTVPDEGLGYDNFLLWLTLPNIGAVTLRRSVHGGEIYKAKGHLDKVHLGSDGYAALKPSHSPQSPNVSKLVLTASGFRDAKLLKNERAEKSPFSLRTLMRYVLVDETRMIDEKSVLLQHSSKVTSEDKGLIKFLLTGIDGSSVETVRSGDQLKAAREAKIELLSQMADKLREAIDENQSEDDVRDLLTVAEQERDDLYTVLAGRQDELDNLAAEVKSRNLEIRTQESRIADLGAMMLRFDELARVYASDVERLSGLEEGGFLLQKFAKMNCPVCGAVPDYQDHDHGLADVEKQRVAVEAEIEKILKEHRDLKAAIQTALREVENRNTEIETLVEDKSSYEILLSAAKELEMGTRGIFASASKKVSKLKSLLEDRRLLASYDAERAKQSTQSIRSRQRAEGLDLNLDLTSNEANELSKVIKQVLTQWNYPGADAVHFSSTDQDIVVDGKRRRDNGAGIRAILHSAFKVAILVYCAEKGRPHPGFLILDAPLLAYRPAEDTRYGELDDDEIALRDADLAGHFYRHLHSLGGSAQFIVIENHKSDQAVVAPFPNIQFTRNANTGRQGFFV